MGSNKEHDFFPMQCMQKSIGSNIYIFKKKKKLICTFLSPSVSVNDLLVTVYARLLKHH